MGKLKEIVEEIEDLSKIFKDSDNENAKKTYNQYIELIITETPKTEQYNLNDYWSRLTI